ncbi:uncharacterized protein LOC129981928 [Argiope bruennichi]|uniref:uncharacterized protein LOC129981928 n=1 Tax=Argiope bruennichi TaxID=94029 RepID=UPI002493F2F5|nr:uncharacterized protein LOC129981928 [Argiope bruennichi]XP_055948960.1 uncharacterized protein LOC129981928 [Argiope bruennichi]XP_055948961.1 uncharacterized protein LOC129981928 [Argiope bruennichi]
MLRRFLRYSSCCESFGCLYRMKFHTNAAKILCMSSFDKDLPNPSIPTPFSKTLKHDTDILLEQLRKAKSVERILELAESHLDVMNAQHLVTSLQIIHDFTRSQDEFDTTLLLENKIFQALCTRIMKIIRVMESQDLITIYKVLSFLKVRNNTYVMQSVLKMLGSHLNDMSLGQLVFLNFLLAKQKHNALVDGLRLALPLVLQVQIEQQLDSDNMTQVSECFQLACRSKLKPAVIEKIIHTLLKKAKSLSPSNAVTVIFALLSLEIPVDGYKELIEYSFEVLSKNLDMIDSKSILPIIRSCRAQGFYHSRFFFEVSKKMVSENWNLEKTWETIRYWKKLNFCPQNVMDHLVHVLCADASTFVTSPLYSPLICLEYLTITGYHPPHLEELLTLICSCEKKISILKETPILYFKFLTSLTTLGHFPENMLHEILNENYLFTMWSASRKQGRNLDFERYAFNLVWALEVYDQKDTFSFPSTVLKSLIQSVCERHENFNYPLQKFIENGLGGEQFLQSGVFSRDGLSVDHVLAMRSGNYPVALSQSESSTSTKRNQVSFIEDMNLPPDTKIVTVISATEDQYIRDPEVLKGWVDLKIKCLRKKKLYPVVINYSSWKNLPDREKIPFLMREIKEAVEEDCSEKKTFY